jgi:molecular chaperone DnaJ
VNYYQTLEVSQKATQKEIKQAYRRLAKCCHPDLNSKTVNKEKIIEVNAAYEILGDPQRRRSYDRQLRSGYSEDSFIRREQRTAQAQESYQRARKKEREADDRQIRWVREVYLPVSKLINSIIKPLDAEIENLSGDPFDDELMSLFQNYLEDCRNNLDRAQKIFSSQPNPSKLASVAASVYYCLDRVSDGIKELEWYTYNYDDSYLHTGKELFRIATSLHRESQHYVSKG